MPERVTGRSRNRPLSRLKLGTSLEGPSSRPASVALRSRSYPVKCKRRLRRHEGPGGAHRPGEGRPQVHPRSGGERSVVEVGELRRCADVRRAVLLRQVRLQEGAGKLRVRPPGRPVHGLEVLELHERAPSVAAVACIEPSRKMRPAALREARPEIVEVLGVRDPLQAGIRRPSARPPVPVGEVERRAIVVVLRVERQVLRREPGEPVVSREKAELSLRLHAAVAHRSRGERRVVVGREVEVVGGRDVDPGGPAHAQGRREKSGLAPIAQREAHPRRVEHPPPHEFDPHVPCGAEFLHVVELDVVRGDAPVRVAGVARRIGRVVRGGALVAEAREQGRVAVAVPVFEHEHGRGLDGGNARPDLRPGAVAGEVYAFIPDPDVPPGLDGLFGRVVDDLVAPQLPRALFGDGVAGEPGHALLDQIGFIGGQADRPGVGAGPGRLRRRPLRYLEARSAMRPLIVRTGARGRDQRGEGEQEASGRWSHLIAAHRRARNPVATKIARIRAGLQRAASACPPPRRSFPPGPNTAVESSRPDARAAEKPRNPDDPTVSGAVAEIAASPR